MVHFPPPWPIRDPSWHSSKAHPEASFWEHRTDFAYTTTIHPASGSVTSFLFKCFFFSLANLSWQLASLTSFWSFVSPTYTTLCWSFQLSTSNTVLSFPSLCRMFTLNKANVSCHLTCLDSNFNLVAKYFKVTLSVHTTTSLEPM